MKHKHTWRKLTRAELAKKIWFCLGGAECEQLAVWCCRSKNTMSIRCLVGRCAKHAPKPRRAEPRECWCGGTLDHDNQCMEDRPKPPAPRRAKAKKRWGHDVMLGIQYGSRAISEAHVVNLLNAAGIVPGKKTP